MIDDVSSSMQVKVATITYRLCICIGLLFSKIFWYDKLVNYFIFLWNKH